MTLFAGPAILFDFFCNSVVPLLPDTRRVTSKNGASSAMRYVIEPSQVVVPHRPFWILIYIMCWHICRHQLSQWRMAANVRGGQ